MLEMVIFLQTTFGSLWLIIQLTSTILNTDPKKLIEHQTLLNAWSKTLIYVFFLQKITECLSCARHVKLGIEDKRVRIQFLPLSLQEHIESTVWGRGGVEEAL